MSGKRKATLWSCDPDAESLSCDSIDEPFAFKLIDDHWRPAVDKGRLRLLGFPGSRLCRCHPAIPSPPLADQALRTLVEGLDEEYGDPDDGYSKTVRHHEGSSREDV